MSLKSPSVSVAIIGAGVSGLTLARVLQKHGVSCTIFESEKSATSRDQGGSLDMHADTGTRALEIAGLLDQFYANARPEGDEMRFVGKRGNLEFVLSGQIDLTNLSPDPKKWGRDIRPEIDRGVLRQILLNSLEPGTIQWDTKLSAIEQASEGSSYKLSFSDGSVHVANIVVGADGAWSRVRSIISAAEPAYTGLTMVELHISDIDTQYPHLGSLIGQGSVFALDDNKGMFAQRNSGGRVRVYLTLRVPENWSKTCGIPFSDALAARPLILDLFDDWDPKLKQLIEVCEDKFVPRTLYRLPVGFKWEHKVGITVVGDAAHLMTPFAGEGANLAMIDAAELGLAIASNKASTSAKLDAAIAKFEKKMWKRGAAAAEETRLNEEAFISDEGLERALRVVKSYGPPSLFSIATAAAITIAGFASAYQVYRLLRR